jgi:hypothetical protein
MKSAEEDHSAFLDGRRKAEDLEVTSVRTSSDLLRGARSSASTPRELRPSTMLGAA